MTASAESPFTAKGLSVSRQQGLEWATRQLSLEPDSPPATIAAASLRQLEESGFVPDDHEDLATRMLQTPPGEIGSSFDLHTLSLIANAETRCQLQKFQQRFFQLSVSQRVSEYLRLRQRCEQSPRVRQQLGRLKKGVKVEIPVLTEEPADVQHLIRVILQMFTAWPGTVGGIYREDVVPMLQERKRWRKAAIACRRRYPELFALAGDWGERLHSGKDPVIKSATTVRRGFFRRWWSRADASGQPASTQSDGAWGYVLSLITVTLLTSGLRFAFRQGTNEIKPLPPFKSINFQDRMKMKEEVLRENLKRLASPPDPFDSLDGPEFQKAYRVDDPGQDMQLQHQDELRMRILKEIPNRAIRMPGPRPPFQPGQQLRPPADRQPLDSK